MVGAWPVPESTRRPRRISALNLEFPHPLAVDLPPTVASLEREVATLMVEALNLDMAPDAIDPVAPLYGDGLGLDSIDILELALVVSKTYGFQLRSDDEDNVRIFGSLRHLTEHIAKHRVT